LRLRNTRHQTQAAFPAADLRFLEQRGFEPEAIRKVLGSGFEE